MNDRAALEIALAANPDDFATHAAYADLLTEQGDPRGDYIRLQLALEDRQQPVERLRAMEQEMFTLRKEYEAEWLGPLAVHVNLGTAVRQHGANVEVTYRRGWLDTVRVRRMSPEVATALTQCPIAPLCADLEVEGGRVRHRLLKALPNLTWLSCVEWPPAEPDEQIGPGSSWFHQLASRAETAIPVLSLEALPRLRYLTFRSETFGDAGVEEVIRSGLLNQLCGLDLCNCAITDDGAQLLAAHPAVPKLEYLRLDENSISPIGIDALAAVGVAISQRQYLGPMSGDDTDADDEDIPF